MKYADNNGVFIAYRTFGEGDDVVLTAAATLTMDVLWPYVRTIAETSRVTWYDKRGTGASDGAANFSFEERVDDSRALMDAAGIERAHLYGQSEGGPQSIIFAAAYPERVKSLTLYGTCPSFMKRRDYPHGHDMTLSQYSRWVDRVVASSAGDRNAMAWFWDVWAPTLAATPGFFDVISSLPVATSPGAARLIWVAMYEADVRALLPSIQVPTTVVHVIGDRVTPIEGGRYLAEHIPGAKLVEIVGNDHFALEIYPAILDAINEHVARADGSERRRVDRRLMTVLFTDIVDSTPAAVRACSAGVPDASDALAAGVRLLHDHPVEGDAVSADDVDLIRHVVFTEGMLFSMLEESDNGFLSVAGEIPAALIALGEGDTGPILRLGADATAMFDAEPYDVPAYVDSAGGYNASSCTDYRLPWKKGVVLDARIDAAVGSVRRLDARHLVGAWNAESVVRTPEYSDWHQLINCNRWPHVKAERAVVEDVKYPNVPTLVMTSDLEPRTPLEDAQRQAARWPRGQLLNIGGALHGAALWSCGPDRVRAFLVTPGSAQAPCDPSELPAFRAVGEFPVTSAAATPLAVDPAGIDSSTDSDRRFAAVALNTALDANSVTARQSFLGKGAGLRGGYAVSSVDDVGFRIDLFEDRFAADVAVSGTLVFPFDGSTPTIDVTFVADGGGTGHLSVIGDWSMGRPATFLNVLQATGEIDGRPVALLLPL